MRKTLIVAACLLVSIGLGHRALAQEQEIDVPADAVAESEPLLSGWTFGLSGGWDENTPVITMPTYADKLQYLKNSGSTFGITAKYAFTKWLYGRADVMWVQKNYKMNRIAEGTSSAILNGEYTNNYLSVPVMAMVSFGYDFRIFAYFGVYMGYWNSGHRKGNSFSMNYLLYGDLSSTEYDEGWGFDNTRDNRFDGGLVFGGGVAYTFLQHYEVSAEARYYYGLTDVQKDYMANRIPHYNSTLAVQFGAANKF